MFNTKTLVSAAAFAVIAAAGIGSASAAPWDVRHDRQEIRRDMRDLRQDRRELRHDMHRNTVDRMHVVNSLRFHRYSVIGNPYWMHDRYVVRTHDRFGRLVFVQIDPYSGRFVREVIL